MSCASQLNLTVDLGIAPDAAEPSWPQLLGSIRELAGSQSPRVRDELLEWADFLEGAAELRGQAAGSSR